MAAYDRQILLTYLNDISSIELLINRWYYEIKILNNQLQNTSSRFNYISRLNEPIKKEKDKERILVTKFMIAVSVFCFFLFSSMGSFFFFTSLLFFGTSIILGMNDIQKENNRVVEYEEVYKAELDTYNQLKKEIPELHENINKINLKIKNCTNKINELDDVKRNLYDVNIIPKQFRNLNSVCWLYDYFKSCQESDLDKIIQTMLLDDINKKIDSIIDRLDILIINQRIQLSEQYKQNELLEKQHKEALQGRAILAENIEMQNKYLQMINANTTVNTIFSIASYYKMSE